LRRKQGLCAAEFIRNHGHQTAITAGIDAARGEAVAVIDGDLQDPPEFIADLYAKLREGYDVVYAVRKKREGETFFKLLTAKIFYRLLKKLTNVDIPLDTGDFRIMSRRLVNVFCSLRERHRFIRGMVSWVGFPQTGLEYERNERFAGETKYTLSRMVKFAFDGITSFSSLPLKFSSYLGILTACAGFLYALYIIYLRLFTDLPVQGWSSIVVVVLLLGGVQLLALGMIGEYLGRIHDESKHRPLYIVENFYDADHAAGFLPPESPFVGRR
jgi:glycosyltransferase involved in cell wall biosynthesis